MQRALNAIQMQGNSDDEALEDDLPKIPHHDQPADQPAVPQQPEQPDRLMNISAAAYNGIPSDSTISLLLSIKGSKALALADTGSTNTFLDYKFAVKHNIAMETVQARKVTIAGGGTLILEAVARNCTFLINNQPFTADFRILQLQGSDVIVGVNWFKLYNPVTFDFLARTVTISNGTSVHTFRDHLLPAEQLLISSDECAKLLQQGASGYILLPSEEENSEIAETDTFPVELQSVLTEFQDIFAPPTGLPPHRDSDHQIPLIPGATPPNIRPYRMSHSQKI
jgi:hypothetical protein